MSLELHAEEKWIPLTDVSAFIRQLSHDLHNDLNALELRTTYIAELLEKVKIRDELTLQMETIHRISKTLHNISLQLQPPTPEIMKVTAVELIGGFQERISKSHPEKCSRLIWLQEVGTSQVEIDYNMICGVLTELFENALHYCKQDEAVTFAATIKKQALCLQFSEKSAGSPKEVNRLGHDPFVTVGHQSYGLGLFYAARVAQIHEGRLEAHYDETLKLFSVAIFLPLR